MHKRVRRRCGRGSCVQISGAEPRSREREHHPPVLPRRLERSGHRARQLV